MEFERLIIVVVRRGRFKHTISNPLAIDVQLIVANARDVDASALDAGIQAELLPQQRR